MCLWVTKSHAVNPIPEMECIKILHYIGKGEWITPYQGRLVPPGHGWFKPSYPYRRRNTEYDSHHAINGGFIHAYIDVDRVGGRKIHDTMPADRRRGRDYAFRAYARDVVAEGTYDDIACRALYIPAFDLTGQHRHAVLDFSNKR